MAGVILNDDCNQTQLNEFRYVLGDGARVAMLQAAFNR